MTGGFEATLFLRRGLLSPGVAVVNARSGAIHIHIHIHIHFHIHDSDHASRVDDPHGNPRADP
jgi:hypothetical protein